ncbi:hypothetical protein AKJ37_01155 [candidate division MSBL1 archaeon SCGC-AAA259I09]|uniref:HTH asnC-type domain-containing protein n=2 Tax=candidate division MSBL1 TaxID=215777 RepID=A0A133UVC2_9EURY|nr:hypothetical protein AKJ36_02165 [candidate division MSBL1 archaeon SCGC-AAA259I07]KXA98158.1 hypothetical protein AKJ37_01155 [candidate division MSBL1 archaeon SCGC-AAA259I09]
MTKNNLDETDREILSILSQESSISYSKLADKIKISRNTVYRRVKKLKEMGVIRENFINNTCVDILKLEEMGITTLVLAMEFEIDHLDKALKSLKDRRDVMFLAETYGEYDIIAMISGEEGKEKQLVSSIREDLKEEKIRLKNLTVFPVSLEKLDLSLHT